MANGFFLLICFAFGCFAISRCITLTYILCPGSKWFSELSLLKLISCIDGMKKNANQPNINILQNVLPNAQTVKPNKRKIKFSITQNSKTDYQLASSLLGESNYYIRYICINWFQRHTGCWLQIFFREAKPESPKN